MSSQMISERSFRHSHQALLQAHHHHHQRLHHHPLHHHQTKAHTAALQYLHPRRSKVPILSHQILPTMKLLDPLRPTPHQWLQKHGNSMQGSLSTVARLPPSSASNTSPRAKTCLRFALFTQAAAKGHGQSAVTGRSEADHLGNWQHGFLQAVSLPAKLNTWPSHQTLHHAEQPEQICETMEFCSACSLSSKQHLHQVKIQNQLRSRCWHTLAAWLKIKGKRWAELVLNRALSVLRTTSVTDVHTLSQGSVDVFQCQHALFLLSCYVARAGEERERERERGSTHKLGAQF